MITMPNSKTQKYDRQLRLWQAHGQAALEQSSICLLGSNNLGTETLKNLILPGIGSFTIIDDKIVDGADVGSSSRAEATIKLLSELNDQVQGKFMTQSPAQIIKNDPQFFKSFSLIICCDVDEDVILSLDKICEKYQIPLVLTRIYGFIGYCRIVKEEHTMIETHPDAIIDLRLDMPWKELADLADGIDFENLTSQASSHMPFPVLLLEASKRWKAKHEALPTTKEEKSEFQKIISSLVINSPDDMENYHEAISHCYRLFSLTTIPSDLIGYLKDPKAAKADPCSGNFWVLMNALQLFIKDQRCIPLAGVVPDMKADTEFYVKIQKVYKEKARADIAKFKEYLDVILQKSGHGQIDQDLIERFCKYCAFIKIHRGTSLNVEYSTPVPIAIQSMVSDPDSNVIFYCLLRAADRFKALHSRFPGANPELYNSDCLAFEALFSTFLKESNAIAENYQDALQEIVRAGGCQLPNMAAIMGGIASQEVIKLLTHQYIPLDSAIIFNGVKSTTSVFHL